MVYEVRLWVIPPVVKEVIGRYNDVGSALDVIKKLMIRKGYKIEDFDLENTNTGELLTIRKVDVE